MTPIPRILIVDDEPLAIQILCKALDNLGDLRFALSGAEALDLVGTEPPDLVLLDARMPGLDGFATCEALKAHHPELPILFVTAAGDPQSELRALAVGAADFIVKPIHPSLVRARVEVHLRLRRQQQQYQATVERLRHSEERFRKLFEETLQASALYQEGCFAAVNQAALGLMGLERSEQMLGLTLAALSPPRQPDGRPSAEKAVELIDALFAEGSGAFEWQLRRGDGRPFLAQFLATQIYQDGQRLLHLVFSDITAPKAAEAALARTRADLEEAQALAHIGSWTLDIAAHRMEWSTEVYRISGMEPGTPVAPDAHFRLIHPEDLSAFENAWQATLQGAPYDITHRIIVDGQVKWVHARAEISFDPDGQPLSAIGTLQDVTAQKEAQVQIEYLAYNDPLTGLLNRAAGQERLAHDLAAAKRHQTSLVLLYLDLDRFKFVNDRYGHGIGDLLLQGVAQRLRDCLRGEDALCRLSGDEFMILLTELSPEHLVAQVSATCERILTTLVQPFSLAGHPLTTSFSIGVAVYPQDGQTGETLMRNADTALYAAKKAGRNGYRFFEPQMNAALSRFTGTRDALRRALDQGEFELHYQPQVELRSGRVVGVEALLRWRRPGVGLVMPDDFIPVAEESGLIIPLGHWVLREVCRQAVAWRQAGPEVPVMALNLSALQFNHAGLDEEVRQALAASGLDPSRLEVELTETTLLPSQNGSQALLAAWRTLGLRLAIDDFGTGSSSIPQLKRLQVDKLKIDRSFIRDLTTDAEDRALVPAMIQLAHALNIRTLAEGVESTAQARLLRALGCDEAQGYLYAKPLPAAQAAAWVTAHSPARLDG